MNVSEAIRKRRSIRKYKPGYEIPQEHIKKMLEAAMMAPSAKNTRPWEFVVLKSDEAKQKAIEIHPYAKHLKDASIGILVCAKPSDVTPGYYPQDCGAAIENILLQALELGYGTCWCGIYPREERVEPFKKAFDIDSIPLGLVVVGVANEEPNAKGFYDESLVKTI